MNLNYLPSFKDKQQFYSSIYKRNYSPEQTEKKYDDKEKEQRKLSKQELDLMLNRSMNNSKQTIIKKQILKIQERNKQWENIKNVQKRYKHNHEVEERLLENGKRTEQKLQSQRKAKQLKQLQHLQPKPAITDRYLINYRPLMQRIPQIIQTQKINLQTISSKVNPKFTPQINPYSAFIAEVRNENDSNFANRLHNRDKQINNMQVLKIKRQNSIKKQLTFKPQINPKSIKLASNLITKSHSEIKTKSKIVEQTFQPQLCKKSQLIVKKSKNVGFSQRLENDLKNRRLREIQLQQVRQSQYSFKPSINKKSQQIYRNNSCKNAEQQSEINDISEQFQNEYETINKFKSISLAAPRLSLTNSEISQKNKVKLQQLFGKKY